MSCGKCCVKKRVNKRCVLKHTQGNLVLWKTKFTNMSNYLYIMYFFSLLIFTQNGNLGVFVCVYVCLHICVCMCDTVNSTESE